MQFCYHIIKMRTQRSVKRLCCILSRVFLEAVVNTAPSAPLGIFTYTVKEKRYLRGSCVSFGRHLHAPIGDMPQWQLARDDTLLSPTHR